MRYELAYTMILFFIFSVIGYILEIISVFTKEKRIVLSRGYLIGPYIPVFGFGGLIITSSSISVSFLLISAWRTTSRR